MTSSTSSHLPETTVNEDRGSPSDEVRQRHPSTNSSAGEKQCPSSSNPTERSLERRKTIDDCHFRSIVLFSDRVKTLAAVR